MSWRLESMEQRLRKLKLKMKKEGLDSLLVTNLTNVRYLTGYSGSNGYVFIAENVHFFTDFRYQEQVKREVTKRARIHIITKGFFDALGSVPGLGKLRMIGFEADKVTVSFLEELKKSLKKQGNFKWVPTKNLVEDMRKVKDQEEVEHIAKAAAITDKTLKEVFRLVKPGVTEQDLSAEIAFRFMRYTASPPAFDSIVASGPNSAMPHAHPTNRRLRKGDFLTFDIGARWNGYSADLTRTVVIGKAGEKHKEIYKIVLDAQRKALEGIHAGIEARKADALARDVIKAAGYGEYFGHSLGHGVGLQTHDGIALSSLAKDKVPEGAVVTVEPGIYIPDWGGVRIEDLVLVLRNGVKLLSHSPRGKLLEL